MIRLLFAVTFVVLALHACWAIMAAAWRHEYGGRLKTDLRMYRRRLDRGATYDDIRQDLEARREAKSFDEAFAALERAMGTNHPSTRGRK